MAVRSHLQAGLGCGVVGCSQHTGLWAFPPIGISGTREVTVVALALGTLLGAELDGPVCTHRHALPALVVAVSKLRAHISRVDLALAEGQRRQGTKSQHRGPADGCFQEVSRLLPFVIFSLVLSRF